MIYLTSLKTVVYTSDNPDNSLLISKLEDTFGLALVRHKNCYLGFLNEAEIYFAEEYLKKSDYDFCFWGGYENSERKILCALYNDFVSDDVPVSAIEFSYRKTDKLSHRDFLGTIMSLGIERDTVGDILIEEGRAVVFVKTEIKDYIISQIDKIGGVGVKISEADLENLPDKEEFKDQTITLSSLRLDAIVAVFAGVSREKAQRLISQGLVMINYSPCSSLSRKVKENDIVSVRKHGKCIIKNLIGETKKGRLKLAVQFIR